jgi:thiosulfate/3-mercaptopyruvate sulfurtransferase
MTTLPTVGPLVSVTWLAEHLEAPSLRIVDASWYLPQANRDPAAEFLAGHIPGAMRFDIDHLSDHASPLPHTLPPAAIFQEEVRRMGIGPTDTVVVYDGSGLNLSAGRAWWMFRTFGHPRVAVLDGGIGAWKAAGQRLEAGTAVPREAAATFVAMRHPAMVRDANAVAQALAAGAQVVDVRARERYEGRAAEPRPGVRSGHMPGSRNLPFTELVNGDGTLKGPDALRGVLQAAGVSLDQPIICSCGSGVSACALALALDSLGHQRVAIYDGSWADWGGDLSRPVVTGPA